MGSTLKELNRFEGSLSDALLHAPLFNRRVRYRGPIIGYTADDKCEPIGCDTHLWKEDGLVETNSHAILGPQGHGKTFLASLIAINSGFYDVGENEIVNREGRRLQRRRRGRIRMDSFKRNANAKSETAPIIENWFGSEVITLDKLSLNFLSTAMDLLFGEAYSLLVSVMHFTDEVPLDLDKKDILKDVLRVLWPQQDRGFDELRQLLQEYLLTVILHMMALQNTEAVMRVRNRQLLRELWPEEEAHLFLKVPVYGPVKPDGSESDILRYDELFDFEALDALLKDRPFLTDSPARFSEQILQRLLHAAWELTQTMKQFEEGEYYSLFSGSGDEFARLLMQRGVSIDLKGLSDKMRSLIEMVIAGINLSAITPGDDGRPRHPERIPDAAFYDEYYGSAENAVATEVMYKERKTQRESGRITVFIFHRFSDLEAVGDAGSSQARKAANTLADIGTLWLGQMPRSEHQRVRELFDPPEHVMLTLETLTKGHFWLKTPHQPWTLVTIVGTDRQVDTLNTEGAQSKLMQKYRQYGNLDYYRGWLEGTTPAAPITERSDDESLQEAMV